MIKWTNFIKEEREYDLSHLDQIKFTYVRAGNPDTQTQDKELIFLVSFSHHCFTGHIGEADWIYPHAHDERFFCLTRYKLSKGLPDLIRSLLDSNPYFLRTFLERREQFFYVEQQYQDETYRVFLEITCPSKNYADVRIDVRSAYHEEPYAVQVGGDSRFKLWRIIDAKLAGTQLPKRKGRRKR